MIKSTYHLFFGSLSTPLRIDIISVLKEKKNGSNVTQISKEIKVEQSKLSHALANLRKCNIVQVKQNGKERVYHLNKTIIPILKLIDAHAKLNCRKACKNCLCLK